MHRAGDDRNDATRATNVMTHGQRRTTPVGLCPLRRGCEDEMGLLSVSPRRIERCSRDGGMSRRRTANRLADQTGDKRRFEAQLFGIGDVLPGAPSAARGCRALSQAKMRTARIDAMRRSLQQFRDCADEAAVVDTAHADAHTLAGNGERNGDHLTPIAGDPIAAGVQVIDEDLGVSGRRAAPRRIRASRSAG